jgi:hypothetical protein
MSMIMPRKAGALVVQEAKKPALAVGDPQAIWANSVNTLLDTFRLISWDPFRGFYELPKLMPRSVTSSTRTEHDVEHPRLKETLAVDVESSELPWNQTS